MAETFIKYRFYYLQRTLGNIYDSFMRSYLVGKAQESTNYEWVYLYK